ncbi:hypothetical protein B2K_38950 [Paenibacillus mucilaginosus K02]|uniref:Uncharacterized protein n=1 Tax=Paenibacillus mucilaginosus K02 TaxID=997761 RepID=R9UP83_9BACL|nr:hypothetical protein B2K_38950 [Paenibacillus mucilaginosus K02]
MVHQSVANDFIINFKCIGFIVCIDEPPHSIFQLFEVHWIVMFLIFNKLLV